MNDGRITRAVLRNAPRMKYFVLVKSTGVKTKIKPDKLGEFFRVIENVTGLDRAIAQALLDHGKPIDHPEYRFFAKGRT